MWGIANPWLTALYILYGETDPKEIGKDIRWWTVIKCFKDGMWKCRNLLAFRNVHKSRESVMKVGLTLVKDYLRRDKKKNSSVDLIVLWKIIK